LSVERIEPELVLKVTPPRGQKSALVRPRLSFDSPQLLDKMAIAVQAPAGFGKTLLLAQWRRESLSRGAIVAWLTLDDRDNGMRFVQGLAAAMAVGSGRPAFAQSVERLLGHTSDELEALTGWLADVVDLGSEIVLILDDVHCLPEQTVRHSLTYLLHNAPANLRVVMASRGRLSLPVGDLLAHGQYAQLGVEELRFQPEETLGLLSARFAGRVDADLNMRLHEITEGWPLGLQLALAALEKSTDLAAAVQSLSTCPGNIQQYFVDSLIARLPREQVDFLIRIALLDMLHPQLCAALVDNPAAGEWLQQLCLLTPIFVEGLDSDWLRIHPLALEFLRGRFASLPLGERQQLHQKAASWLAEHGLFEEAARQALMAGSAEQAHQLVEHCLYDIMLRGQFGRVLEWIEILPTLEVGARPGLRLAAAWALSIGARHAEAAGLIAHIQNDPQAEPSKRCEADAIAAAAAMFADRPDEAYRIIAPWLEQPAFGSARLQSIVAGHRARFSLFSGQPEKARHLCQSAPSYECPYGLDAIRGFNQWCFGGSYLWEGRMLPAQKALRASLERAEQDIGRRSAVAVSIAAGLAAVLLECDEVQEAHSVLANRLDAIDRGAAPESIALGYVTLARLAVLQGQLQRAYELLDALFALGEIRHTPRFVIASLFEQIRMHSLRGHADTCLALWRRLDALVPDSVREQRGLLGPELAVHVSLAKVYVCLAQRDWPGMLAALEPAALLTERLRRGRESVQIKLLKALALRNAGDNGLDTLREAVGLAEDYGMRRSLEDIHPEIAEWIRALRAEEGQAALAVSLTLPAGPSARNEQSHAQVTASRLLTPKEREVLQLLARNLSNKQIAQALSVGEETVKWHLKNLFGKFQAGTRKHVVDRAYMLGILRAAD
jgi:LuxR family maltose regulon positive regulatory protein